LHNLTGREQEILLPYIVNDFRSRRIGKTDPVAQGLADDGILYAPDVAIAADGGKAYNIQDWVRVYLKKRIELVGGNRNPNKAAQGDS
jgi:superinfection exclusion protein B